MIMIYIKHNNHPNKSDNIILSDLTAKAFSKNIIIPKTDNIEKNCYTPEYKYNPQNLWGFIFCKVNKRTSLNTFIAVNLCDTLFA